MGRRPLNGVVLVALAALVACRPPNVQITETPIKITTEERGRGDPVGRGDVVRIDYLIELPDGKELLRQRNYRFKIGTDSVIRGIDEAMLGMRLGGSRTFTCPPHKHWGRAGYGDGLVPPATDLLVELKLVKVESRARRRVATGDR